MCDVKVCKYPDKICYYEFFANDVKGDTYRFAKEKKLLLDDLEHHCEKVKTEEIVLKPLESKAAKSKTIKK